MKKLIFILAMIFAFQSMAIAAPAGNLKAVYEDYVYATTVEWDQVDAEMIAAINAQFAADLADLQEAGLLSPTHVKAFFEAEVSSGRVPKEILHGVLNPAGELDLSSLSTLLKDHQHALQDRGASWEGEGKKFFKIVAWGFLPALIIIGVITTSGRKEMCTEGAGRGYGFHEPFPCN